MPMSESRVPKKREVIIKFPDLSLIYTVALKCRGVNIYMYVNSI